MGPKDGKYEVVVPVGLPDEGTYECLDMFLAKNTGYTEISARSFLEWARRSGFLKITSGRRKSNDNPEIYLDIPSIDNGSVDEMIKSIAPLQGRNYVVMEVKGNLIKESREGMLKKFSGEFFKRVAHVQLGEPGLEFKKKSQEATLKLKQELSDREFKNKKEHEKRLKEIEKKRKAAEKAKKKAEKERAKRVEDLRKVAEAKKKEAEKKKAEEAGEEPKKEDEPKEEEKP